MYAVKRLLALAVAVCMVSCCKTEDIDLSGTWIRFEANRSGWGHGMKLDSDGTASEVNIWGVILDSWEKDGDKLIIKGKNVQHRIALPFTDTLIIDKKSTRDSIILRQGDREQMFLRMKDAAEK